MFVRLYPATYDTHPLPSGQHQRDLCVYASVSVFLLLSVSFGFLDYSISEIMRYLLFSG